MTPSEQFEQRGQMPVWFIAPSNFAEEDAQCCECGFDVLPGEYVAEVDNCCGGMLFIHRDCFDALPEEEGQ